MFRWGWVGKKNEQTAKSTSGAYPATFGALKRNIKICSQRCEECQQSVSCTSLHGPLGASQAPFCHQPHIEATVRFDLRCFRSTYHGPPRRSPWMSSPFCLEGDTKHRREAEFRLSTCKVFWSVSKPPKCLPHRSEATFQMEPEQISKSGTPDLNGY